MPGGCVNKECIPHRSSRIIDLDILGANLTMLSFTKRLIFIINFNNIALVPLRLRAVLAGDNAATFDVPMLRRNGGHNFVAELTSVNIRCTDNSLNHF